MRDGLRYHFRMVDLFSPEEDIDQNGGRWLIDLGPDYMALEQQKEGVGTWATSSGRPRFTTLLHYHFGEDLSCCYFAPMEVEETGRVGHLS